MRRRKIELANTFRYADANQEDFEDFLSRQKECTEVEIFRCFMDGDNISAISRKFDISFSTVKQTIKNVVSDFDSYKGCEDQSCCIRYGLSTRVSNVLMRNGIFTEKQLKDKFENTDIVKLTGIGKVGMKEIEEFLKD